MCEVHAGEGGTDAQDWTEMMLRMYLRWAERRGFDVEVDETTPGQEAGLLSATFIVKGRYAYGLLQAERGVHRLYRISPFDSQARRQTSYAAMDVTPFVEDVSDEVKIDEKDLRVDYYRSSGAGGQHVNVTDSAVRLTHLPTGIVVTCQNERSQIQNKARAMQVLASKLAERQREERLAEMAAITGPPGSGQPGRQLHQGVRPRPVPAGEGRAHRYGDGERGRRARRRSRCVHGVVAAVAAGAIRAVLTSAPAGALPRRGGVRLVPSITGSSGAQSAPGQLLHP